MNGFFDNKLNTNVYRIIICKKKWYFSELKTIGVLWNRKYVEKEKVTVYILVFLRLHRTRFLCFCVYAWVVMRTILKGAAIEAIRKC